MASALVSPRVKRKHVTLLLSVVGSTEATGAIDRSNISMTRHSKDKLSLYIIAASECSQLTLQVKRRGGYRQQHRNCAREMNIFWVIYFCRKKSSGVPLQFTSMSESRVIEMGVYFSPPWRHVNYILHQLLHQLFKEKSERT